MPADPSIAAAGARPKDPAANPAGLPERDARAGRRLTIGILAFTLFALLGLPFAVLLDLTGLSDQLLRARAAEIDRIMRETRSVYSSEVVAPWLAMGNSMTNASPHAPTLPFTLSIAIAERLSSDDLETTVGVLSDHPFMMRAAYVLDPFERAALDAFRDGETGTRYERSGTLFSPTMRTATPIVMESSCVSCHNSHPESTRQDWRVGEVRGIQEVTVRRSHIVSLLSFKWLLIFGAISILGSSAIIAAQYRQERVMRRINDLLSELSVKIARFVPRQIYEALFSGARDAVVQADRKRLTIFLSDIADFTEISAHLQPEVLSRLLNEYFSEMSRIADRHGGTVDKFIGDAMLVFFGDPESDGAEVDAARCLDMAREMQDALVRLQASWRREGVETPLRARMGMNTGYCDVGNFGSDDRMDYTIIGAEVNLAARLQQIAPVGGICMSFESFALLRDRVVARPMEPIRVKGIARQIVPYIVQDDRESSGIVNARQTGLDLFLDAGALDAEGREAAAAELRAALDLLDADGKR